MEKMNPEVKKQWLKALRSGKYRKGTKALLKKGGYCCLGVLTDLYAKSPANKEKIQWKGAGQNDGTRSFAGVDDYTPEVVMKWAGLKEANPYVRYEDRDGEIHHDTLGQINDGSSSLRRVGFKQIADIIEKAL